MEKLMWSSTEIRKLYRLEERGISRQTLLNAEKRGDIPTAGRIERGRVSIRQWHLNQLPAIGSRFGFLEMPTKQIVMCIYSPKGGILKTTVTYNLARTLALNGIKTLIIGLDIIQGSITGFALPEPPIETLKELDDHIGLYHHFYEGAKLNEIIKPTSLPNLFVIPETPELNQLEMTLKNSTRREYLLKDKLISNLSEYKVIVFDNSPSWNQMVANALTASNVVISPMGCDIESYKSLNKNLSVIQNFGKEMNLNWDNFIQIPTLLEKNNISEQIKSSYVDQYGANVINSTIRRTIKAQEARIFQQCAIEHDPKSELAKDYYGVIQEVWDRILDKE